MSDHSFSCSDESDEQLTHLFEEYHAKNMANENPDSLFVQKDDKKDHRGVRASSASGSSDYQKGRARILGQALDACGLSQLKVTVHPPEKRMRRGDAAKKMPTISLWDNVCDIENLVANMRQEIVDCKLNYPESKQSAELLKETLKHVKCSLKLAGKLLKLSPTCLESENPKKVRGKYKTFTQQQEGVLNEYFRKSARPTQPLIEHIAKKLAVDKTRVNRWYTNQRHKQSLANRAKN